MAYVSRPGFQVTIRWFVVHADGHEHQPDGNLINASGIITLVTKHNDGIRKQIEDLKKLPNPDIHKIQELEGRLKKVRKYFRSVPTIVTIKYRDVYLTLKIKEYQSLLKDKHIVVYWYGRLFLFPNLRFFEESLVGDPEDVFIVDNDWLRETAINVEGEEYSEIYEC